MPSLDNIEEEISNVLDSFADGDFTQEQKEAVEQYLEKLCSDEREKIDGFARVVRARTAKAEACREESRRLAARAKSEENGVKFLKSLYLGVLEKHGLKRIDGAAYSISTRSIDVVNVFDEKIIPEELCPVELVHHPDKRGILAAMKRGETVPGCELSKSTSLVIR